jgi:glutamine synthetase type III
MEIDVLDMINDKLQELLDATEMPSKNEQELYFVITAARNEITKLRNTVTNTSTEVDNKWSKF